MTHFTDIYLIHDDDAVLATLKSRLAEDGFSLVHGCSSTKQFFDDAALDRPGCVVVDLDRNQLDTNELEQRIHAANGPMSLVVMSEVEDLSIAIAILKLMERRNANLLKKPFSDAEFLDTIRRASEVSYVRSQERIVRNSIEFSLAKLTEEERYVMDAMLANEQNKTISKKLGIAMRTVDRRRRTIFEKMGVNSLLDLALLVASQPHLDVSADLATQSNPNGVELTQIRLSNAEELNR